MPIDFVTLALAKQMIGGDGGEGGSVKIDTTLTKEGSAADAKAVGDALNGKAPHVLHVQIGEDDYGNLISNYSSFEINAHVNAGGSILVKNEFGRQCMVSEITPSKAYFETTYIDNIYGDIYYAYLKKYVVYNNKTVTCTSFNTNITANEDIGQWNANPVTGKGVYDYAVPIPETAEVGQTIVVKAVDENGKPTEWECADIDSPDEYVTLFHKKFDTNVASIDEWGGEYFKHNAMHTWATDTSGNDVQADGIYVRVHVPKQNENIVSSGEIKIYVGKGKPTYWGSWCSDQKQPYIGFSSFVSTSGQEVWAKWDYDLRTRTLIGTRSADVLFNGNAMNGTISAIPFDQAVAKNNWTYLSGVLIELASGSFPAGTEIIVFARKLNAKKVPDIPNWGV